MSNLRGQFILSHLLPFLIILPITGLVLLYLIEAQVMLGDLANDLEERAGLIAEAVARQPGVLASQESATRFLRKASQLTGAEIYLLDANGALVAAVPELAEPPNPRLVADTRTEGASPHVMVAYSLSGPEGEAIAPVVDLDEQIIGLVGVRESISGLAESFSPLRRLVVLAILGGMAFGALTGISLAGRLAQPIKRTSDTVAAIASGKSVAPIPATGPAELRQLAESVNTLVVRLHSLEEMRRRAFANIVHELGRPLGAVLAAVQVLRGSAGEDPEVRRELLAGVQKELTGMEPLLDDLAQLYADAVGERRLDRRLVDTSQWLHDILPPWREAAAAKGLAWRVELPQDLPEVEMDGPRLAQVIGNLLSNAIKFTTTGGVAISAAANGREVTIAIADTGPGIPQSEQARIFEPFYRGDIPQRTTEGLGVGLAIARSLAEAHGGRLTVQSAPGRGSVFTLHLPYHG